MQIGILAVTGGERFMNHVTHYGIRLHVLRLLGLAVNTDIPAVDFVASRYLFHPLLRAWPVQHDSLFLMISEEGGPAVM